MAIRGTKANQRPLASGAATFQLLHIIGVLISQFASANTASFHEFPFTKHIPMLTAVFPYFEV